MIKIKIKKYDNKKNETILIAGQDFDRIDKIRLHRYINSCAIENGSYEEKFFLYYQGITELTVNHK